MELNTIFLVVFISTLAVLILNLLFGDILDSVLGIENDFINMTTLLCFIGLASAFGYVMLTFTPFSLTIVLVVAIVIASLLTVILNIFVFIPLSKMESSTSFRLEDMKGKIGEVTLSIPANSVGEVRVSHEFGIVTRTAKSFNGEDIKQGDKVMIIDVANNVFHVEKTEDNIDDLMQELKK